MSATFKVTGNKYYYDDILKADTIEFETNSKLILGPVKEAPPGAPRTLTIIAKSINITDQAEITYDLDGNPGIDADTPQPPQTTTALNGSRGSPHYWPDNMSPGSYPHADNGGPGKPGDRGSKGLDGIDAPTLEIWVGDISVGSMKINFKGQDGGKGGDGGDGGDGGGGQKGSKAKKDDAWYDGEECVQEPGRGGKGGGGGDVGWPGVGGDGGNGGIVKVFTKSASLTKAQGWTYSVSGGKGGDPGKDGKPGTGGQGGPQGDTVGPCPSRPEFKGEDGKDGRSMDDIDPNWRRNLKGNDGNDGDYSIHELNVVPN